VADKLSRGCFDFTRAGHLGDARELALQRLVEEQVVGRATAFVEHREKGEVEIDLGEVQPGERLPNLLDGLDAGDPLIEGPSIGAPMAQYVSLSASSTPNSGIRLLQAPKLHGIGRTNL
jgi:hypothetical protein